MSTKRWQHLLAALISTLALGVAHADGAQAKADSAQNVTSRDLDRVFRRSTLQIATPDARLHRFNVWIADDDQRRARGLMFIRQLEAADGMLFIYPQPQLISMWMKNTYVPLDMLFVATDGKVIRVVENTEPLSLKTIESGDVALAVVELPAGTAAKLKIREGARVIHPAFSSQ